MSDMDDMMRRLPIGQNRLVCPACSHTRRKSNQRQRTLSVTVDDEKAVFNCHHCGDSGVVRLRSDSYEHRVRKKEAVVNTNVAQLVPKPKSTGTITQAHIDYLAGRGISAEVAASCGVHSAEKFIRDVGQTGVLCFPYPGAVKYRSTESKGFSCSGSPASYFLQENVKAGSPLIITEGEMDAISLIQVGYSNAISVPNGAPVKVTDGKIDPSEDGKFKYVWGAASLYNECRKIIIATDNDEPGNALAEELARRIGKYRCYRVKFPASMKDCNEVLMQLGAEALREIVDAAAPWPVAGLYQTDHYASKVMDLYTKGEAKGASTGIGNLDKLYTVAPGQFTIVTGIPSSGKSEFVDHLMVELAGREGWSFAVCSFENPPEAHIVKLIEKRSRMNFYDNPEHKLRLIEDDMKQSLDWVSKHFYWMEHADGAGSNIDNIIERAKVAVMRYGVRGVVIDPYNFIDRPSNMPETEFVSDILTKIKTFAVGHDVHVWFVAHPYKLRRGEDGSYPVPGGYEISGSAAWFAKADCGLTVHRTPEDVTEVHLWKVRFKWIGKVGKILLAYDKRTGRYCDGEEVIEEGKAKAEPYYLND